VGFAGCPLHPSSPASALPTHRRDKSVNRRKLLQSYAIRSTIL
jgi:hypothetical protein